jgi:hypothetical protein
MTKKEQNHVGQQPLPNLSQYDDDPDPDPFFEHYAEVKLPRGMPTLAMIKTETTLYGLPPSDAEHLFNVWLSNGFKTARHPVKNWKAVVRIWHRCRYFPSLREADTRPKPSELMSYQILDDIATWTAFKKLDVHKLGAEFKEWCEKHDRPKLVSSFIKLLNAKL